MNSIHMKTTNENIYPYMCLTYQLQQKQKIHELNLSHINSIIINGYEQVTINFSGELQSTSIEKVKKEYLTSVALPPQEKRSSLMKILYCRSRLSDDNELNIDMGLLPVNLVQEISGILKLWLC